MRRQAGFAVVGIAGALALCLSAVSMARVDVPKFVDVTEASGLIHVNSFVTTPESPDGGWEFVVGGGVAAFDCDSNDLPDLYLAGGSSPASLYRNTSELGGPIRFERQSDAATDLVQVSGAYPLDVDSDGQVDLAVLRHGENVILRGLGDCQFERANETWGIDGGNDWTTAFSATWESGATLPTLVFGNYQAVDSSNELIPGTCADHQLFRPVSDGTRYGPPTTLSPGWCTLSMLFSDWDRSGRRDLRISNDRHYYVQAGQEQLWHFEPETAPRLYTEEDGWQRLMVFGMGIASHDISGDGYPEVYLTSMGNNRLQVLSDGPDAPSYVETAREVGASTGRPVAGDDTRPSTSWHAEFQDVNNDGLIDLYVSKGNLDAVSENAMDDPSSLMLGRPGGRFVERSGAAGVANFASARGAALVDLDLDGLLDLVEVNQGEPAEVWQNVGSGRSSAPRPMGGWLAIQLRASGANRDAVGAWVEVKTGGDTQRREVVVGGGHGGGQLGPIHFGIGDAKRARVRVQWPGGAWDPWQTVRPNSRVILRRGVAAAQASEDT